MQNRPHFRPSTFDLVNRLYHQYGAAPVIAKSGRIVYRDFFDCKKPVWVDSQSIKQALRERKSEVREICEYYGFVAN